MITRRPSLTFSLSLCLLVQASASTCADGCAQFDLPAVVESCDVTSDDFASSHPSERMVQITIPLSTLVHCKRPQAVAQLLVQVRGLSRGFQVIDYLPRTLTYANIEGSIAVESHRESNHSIGLDASGVVSEAISLSAAAKSGTKNGKIQRYQQLPEKKLLLASGTIERGGGVYYKFLHSDQTTLEGGHDLVITFRVADTWRGGLIRVDCHASGVEKNFIGSNDNFVAGKRTFVVATYLKGDEQARRLAQQYAQLEKMVFQYAQAWAKRQQKARHQDLLASFGQILGHPETQLPDGWSDKFMLYDAQSIRTQIRPYVSKSLQRATDEFVDARSRLLSLNR